MFGIIRPCRHRLGGELAAAWQAHLCGMCLSLRDDHGHAARLATNYDGLVVSVLAEAQAREAPRRRAAGRCALRGMRRADVAIGDCARLAATVSLVLAAAKMRDHVADGDGPASRSGLRTAAGMLASRWAAQAADAGGRLGFDTAVLTQAVGRQATVEATAGIGTPLLAVTEPTETATAAAFAYTAVLAGRPGNEAALAEAGRLFGRVAHLLDSATTAAVTAADQFRLPVRDGRDMVSAMTTDDASNNDVPARWNAAPDHPDMWMDPAQDPRFGADVQGERETLLDYLRTYRMTLEMKCADLDADQLARRSVPPSTMSLLGLVRHMADVERYWFRRVMGQADAPPRYDDFPDCDWLGAVADPAVVADAWQAWREEVAFAGKFVDDCADLGTRGTMRDGSTVALREVLVHMIEEYARHCGHADLLRERIDGRVGQ